MAILYIGPHRNPDFATDYHISPILAPNHLLAEFPPLLMQCGEKDPFVDDTVIFAGRVREAKRARKVELDLALSGKSARFGESLRMSSLDHPHSRSTTEMKRERDKLASESESDWVQMVLFAGWSHGYLQMPLLLSEATPVSFFGGCLIRLLVLIYVIISGHRGVGRVDCTRVRPISRCKPVRQTASPHATAEDGIGPEPTDFRD